MQKIVLVLVCLLALSSCFEAPSYGEIPRITDIQFSRDSSIVDPNSSVIMKVFFEDGDGDLGRVDENSTKNNVFLHDNQLGFIDSVSYWIPFIPSKGSVPDISGNIRITIQKPGEPTGLIASTCNFTASNGKIDTISYDIQIRDRSGNISNLMTSPPLIIDCR